MEGFNDDVLFFNKEEDDQINFKVCTILNRYIRPPNKFGGLKTTE